MYSRYTNKKRGKGTKHAQDEKIKGNSLYFLY